MGTIHQEEVTITNIHTPNIGALNFILKKPIIRLISTERNQHKNSGRFQYPNSSTDKSSRQKITKETWEFITTINQADLIDIYRLFYMTAAQHIFFSKIVIFGHKAGLSEYKRQEIIPWILLDNNGITKTKSFAIYEQWTSWERNQVNFPFVTA
jgi:hypothetical protein